VRLDSLLITDYRNLARVELRPIGGATAFIGENAQGKSNLLEAIYSLATMRSVRAESEAQVIRRGALSDVLPAARVVADVSTRDGPVKFEVTVMLRPSGSTAGRTVKVNGVSKRLSAAVGRVTAVLFTADDMEMLTGSPSLRRRFLDLMLSQSDAHYSVSRSRFERLLQQRNALLKRIREGLARRDELPYWDDELSEHGGRIVHARATTVTRLAEQASDAHARLAPGEVLEVRYVPSLQIEEAPSDRASVTDLYLDTLRRTQDRDIGAGMTLSGPHRDDLACSLDGVEAGAYASRAQQRTISLALRLAEFRFLSELRGDAPILLLDDILSEMDAHRRETVMAAIADVDQLFITGTDLDRFPAGFLSTAKLFAVESGSIRLLESSPAPG
jgi:DNA replication and repair protein RecF